MAAKFPVPAPTGEKPPPPAPPPPKRDSLAGRDEVAREALRLLDSLAEDGRIDAHAHRLLFSKISEVLR